MIEASIKPRARKQKVKKPEFHCEFCSVSFTRESSLLVHVCEKKRRLLDKDSKHVRIGFQVYQKFWSYIYPYSKNKEKTYSEFINFAEYGAFTAFGKYLVDIRAINPMKFVEFLLKTNIKLKDWKKEEVYLTYIRELSKTETPDAAIERNILLMQQWANDNDCNWIDFFRKISPSAAVQFIKGGRISPWAIYTTDSGQEMMGRFSDEQIDLVRKYIEPEFWVLKFKRNKEDFDNFREILSEAGL